MFSEGNVTHPVKCDSPLKLVMAVWRISLFELARSGVTSRCRVMAVWCASYLTKVCLTAIAIGRGLSHPTMVGLFAEGRRALKPAKAL